MDLAEYKRRAYSQSKNFSWAATVVQAATLGIAVYLALVSGPVSPYFGLVPFLAPVATFLLRNRSRHHYGFGERARRAQRLEDGLGRRPSEAELLELADNRALLPAIDPAPIGAEFTSELKPGATRLAHITQESAYYTKSRATFASRLYLGSMVVGLLMTVTLLWVLVQAQGTPGAEVGANWAKATAALLAFFLSGLFAERWLAFESLAVVAAKTFDRCDAMRKGAPSEFDVLLAISSYDIALGRAPPIPTFIHRVGRKQLHEDWTTLMKAAPPTPPAEG